MALTRTSRIRPVSAKKTKLNRIYSALARAFIEKHPFCQHWIAECGLNEEEVIVNNGWYEVKETHPYRPSFVNYRGFGQVPPSCEIHHKRGRGPYFLDASTFMAVRFGHSGYIHGKPKHSYAMGYMLLRN